MYVIVQYHELRYAQVVWDYPNNGKVYIEIDKKSKVIKPYILWHDEKYNVIWFGTYYDNDLMNIDEYAKYLEGGK